MLPSVYNKQLKYDVHEVPTAFPVIKTDFYVNTPALTGWADFNQLHIDSSITGVTKINLQQIAMNEETGNKKPKSTKKNDLLSPKKITAEQLDKLNLSNTADAVKMLPGVIMMNGRLTIRGGIQNMSGNLSDVEPLLVVDGVQTRAGSVVDYLNSIPPSNIEYIEVFTGPEASMYGSRGGNGAIVVKTSNEIRTKKDDSERQTIVATGFYKDQNFYQPPYDSYTVREANFTDNRATIYWNGEVITDSTGKASVSFYTADLKNDYIVTVQGITEKGELIYKTYTIKRK
jgi:outer membrane receptor protein involved in Fe transport